MRTHLLIATLAAAAVGLGGATLVAAQSPPPGAAQAPGAGAWDGRPGMRGGMHQGRGMHGRRGPGGERMAGRMAAELNLTDSQKQQLRALREAERPAMQAAAERFRTNQQKLRGLSPGDPNWDRSVDEAARQAADAASQRVRDGARMRAELWKVLTPEQRTKLASMQAQREQQMQQRRDERRRRLQQGGPDPRP